MNLWSRWPTVLAVALLAAPAGAANDDIPAVAADRAAVKQQLATRVAATLPLGWQSRIVWRERALMLFMTPPVGTGFDVIYKPEATLELVRKLCPPLDDAIWASLEAGQDIDVVPTVLGKSGVKTSCRKLAGAPPA